MMTRTEPPIEAETDRAERPDATYETFMRVKSGISDAALRAAGLPPARELTYDAYLAAFAPAAAKDADDLDRLRGERAAQDDRMPADARLADERPGPPPLGRRLILAEAADGSWQIVNDPAALPPAPPPRRYFAKAVGLLMGVAFAFVVAAYIGAVYLPRDRAGSSTAAALPRPPQDSAADAAAGLQLDTASGNAAADGREATDAAPAPAAAPVLPVKTVAPAPEPQRVPTEAVRNAAAPTEPAAAEPEMAVPAAAVPPRPAKAADLPKSTPTAQQRRLPNSTKPASTP